MTKRVRAHTLLRDGRQFRCDLSGVAFDQRMNTESRERVSHTIEEYMLRCVSTANER
jgi:hypothetical protein